jgi:threonine/homoserine/homoserine lactone efflux protein
MPEGSTMTLFAVAAVALLLTPGPAVLYIVARSIDQGRTAGLVSTLGINFGTLFHIAAAALGVSALLMSSALAFSVLKYAGAFYLIYLGVRKLRERDAEGPAEPSAPRRLASIFYEGVLVNLLNPKTALFFFAFLPQFVDPGRGAVASQILFLGGLFVLMALVTDGTYAVLAGSIADSLRGNLRLQRAQRYFAGGVYLTLGVATALAGPGKRK